MTNNRTELATDREYLARRRNWEEVQRLVTDLVARIEDKNFQSEMFSSVRKTLADRIDFFCGWGGTHSDD